MEVLRQIQIGKELAGEAERRAWRISNLSRQRGAECKWIESVWNTAHRIRRNVFRRIADEVGTRTARPHSSGKLNHSIQRQTSLRCRNAGDLPTTQQLLANSRARKVAVESRHFVNVTGYDYVCA